MDIFTRLGIVEHTGHEIPTIINIYGINVFEISDSFIRVIIPFNEEVLENHGSISSSLSGFNDDSLSDKEKRILKTIEMKPNSKVKELSEMLNIPFRSSQRYISDLSRKGFIQRVGSNKNGSWKVVR